MPTYEYECAKCGDKFDVFQKMSDEPVAKCPKCGGKVERLISAGAGFIFKGSGFYATDYKNKKNTKDEKIPPCAKSGECKSCPLDEKNKSR